jgi:tRNA (guanine-N7-)-methyltransferase
VLPAEIQLSAVYILFPDPWPKLRHHKHRVIQPEFISELERRMAPDAALYFRTDFQPYFEDAVAKFRQKNWKVSVTEAWPFERESVFQSRAVRYHSFVARLPGSL